MHDLFFFLLFLKGEGEWVSGKAMTSDNQDFYCTVQVNSHVPQVQEKRNKIILAVFVY